MHEAATLTFLDAAGTVTGSRYLLEANAQRVTFSGDLGRSNDAVMQAPKALANVVNRQQVLS